MKPSQSKQSVTEMPPHKGQENEVIDTSQVFSISPAVTTKEVKLQDKTSAKTIRLSFDFFILSMVCIV